MRVCCCSSWWASSGADEPRDEGVGSCNLLRCGRCRAAPRRASGEPSLPTTRRRTRDRVALLRVLTSLRACRALARGQLLSWMKAVTRSGPIHLLRSSTRAPISASQQSSAGRPDHWMHPSSFGRRECRTQRSLRCCSGRRGVLAEAHSASACGRRSRGRIGLRSGSPTPRRRPTAWPRSQALARSA